MGTLLQIFPFIGSPLPSSHHSVYRCSIDIANWQVLPLTLRQHWLSCQHATRSIELKVPAEAAASESSSTFCLLSTNRPPLQQWVHSLFASLSASLCLAQNVRQFFSTLPRIVAIDWALIRRRRKHQQIVIFRRCVCVFCAIDREVDKVHQWCYGKCHVLASPSPIRRKKTSVRSKEKSTSATNKGTEVAAEKRKYLTIRRNKLTIIESVPWAGGKFDHRRPSVTKEQRLQQSN